MYESFGHLAILLWTILKLTSFIPKKKQDQTLVLRIYAYSYYMDMYVQLLLYSPKSKQIGQVGATA